MPTLSDALKTDLSNFNPVESESRINAAVPNADSQPIRGTMMRCPLPPLFQPSPDSLRSYYLKGQVPQFRIFTPPAQQSSGSSTTTTTVAVTSSSGGGSTPAVIVASLATIKTGVLSPGQSFTGTVSISKSFQLLSLSASGAMRFELYGTAIAQSSDAGRALDVPPAAGTTQNIICDVALDTAPYQWAYQNRVGANGDSPQTGTVYVTITNLGTSSTALTATLTYVGLES
jgi:hypothetical protein